MLMSGIRKAHSRHLVQKRIRRDVALLRINAGMPPNWGKFMDPTTSPFYQWLDHERIRTVLHDVLNLRPGERLVLLKGLVPSLVKTLGAEEAESFLAELAAKVRRYEEARTHPGEGRLRRQNSGEQMGGPTPEGHRHLAETRNPDRPGGRSAERLWEAAVWARSVDPVLADRYTEQVAEISAAYVSKGMRPGEAEIAAWEVVAQLHGLTMRSVEATREKT